MNRGTETEISMKVEPKLPMINLTYECVALKYQADKFGYLVSSLTKIEHRTE